MVAPGFLQNAEVQKWLNGLEPAWVALDFDSFNALRREPSRENRALSLVNNLAPDEIAISAVARNALLLIRHALERGGLKLTATGNLSRAVVEEMRSLIEWPDYDPVEALSFCKVVNEPDFLPLHFVRLVAQASQFLRPHRGKLVATRLGKQMLAEPEQGALQAILFHVTFWHVDLAYFGRGLFGRWPQTDIGVVLWSLSASATGWQTTEALTRLCTVPIIGVLESAWDVGSMMMESRVLQPLLWFGLLERRSESDAAIAQRYYYRKSPLFDRLLSFNVRGEETTTPLQH
jgi:hypothetical protein